eukprot:jgi/Mesvir1/2809/Mv13912-RA.3
MKSLNGNPGCLGSPYGVPPLKPAVAKFTSSYSMVNRPDKNRRKWLAVLLLAKTRLAMVAMLALIIGLSSFATYRVSTHASAKEIDDMSSMVRISVTGRQFDKIESFFLSLEQTGTAIYKHLDKVLATSSTLVTPEALTSIIAPIVWTMFASSPEAVLVLFMSPNRLAVGFRRNGPEQYVLGSNTSQILIESTNQTYGHLFSVDPLTGDPVPDGKVLLICNDPAPSVAAPCPENASPDEFHRSDVSKSTALFAAGLSVPPGYFKYELMLGASNEPVIAMAGQVRSTQGDLLGVIATMFVTDGINTFLSGLESVQSLGGHAFIFDPVTFYLLAASHGKVVHIEGNGTGGGVQVSLLKATESDDPMIWAAAHFLNESVEYTDLEHPVDLDLIIEVHEQDMYLTTRWLFFHGAVLEMALAVPKIRFRNAVDNPHDDAIRVVVLMASLFFVVGTVLAIIVTLQISRKVKMNVLLEEDLDEAVRENEVLRTRLISVDGQLEKVDMETPMQKAAKLMEEIANGKRKATPELMQQIMALMKAKDRDMPQFLRTDTGAENLDKELAEWLKSTLGGERVKQTGGSRSETPTGGMLAPPPAAKRGRHSLSGAVEKPSMPTVYDTSVLSMLHAATSGITPIPHLERRVSTVLTGVVVMESDSEGESISGNQKGRGVGGTTNRNLEEIRALVRRTGDWSLDTMELDEKTGGQVVVYIGYALFVASGALHRFHIDELKLVNFLGALNRGMPDNPYHNRAHIADVANAMFHVMTSSGMYKFISEFDMLAGIVASVIHDYKHPVSVHPVVQRIWGHMRPLVALTGTIRSPHTIFWRVKFSRVCP